MNVFKKNKTMLVGVLFVCTYFLWALGWEVYSRFILGSFFSPYVPKNSMQAELTAPNLHSYFLGTDIYGRSMIEVVSAGLSYSLGMAFVVSITAATIGIVIGYTSIRGHKIIGRVFDMVTNILFVFPGILIAIMIMSVTGKSYSGLYFAMVITGWPAYARLAKGETKRVMALSFVESAKAIGVSEFRLFFKVILPAILPFTLIQFILGISGVIVNESVLGFLGLGGSTFSWGALLSMAKSVLLEAPYLVTILSITLAGLIIGLNLLGDGLRDYLDPHSK